MADELPPDLQNMVGKLMKAAHRKGDRRGERKGFAAAVGMFLKAMSAGDAGNGGALIPPPQYGKKKRKKKGKRKPVTKGCATPANLGGLPHAIPTETRKARDFGSTQLDFVGYIRDAILDIGRAIPAKDLAADGREDEPHVTVKYGLHKDVTADSVAKAVGGQGSVDVWFDGFGVFAGKEYDVLFLKVAGPGLKTLNGLVADLPHTDTHPKYVPHATVAYVKTGLGDFYAKELANHLWAVPQSKEGCLRFRTMTYSAASGQRYAIDLVGEPTRKSLRTPSAFRLSPDESVVYWKAIAEQQLDTPEAIEKYAADLHGKTVKELADEKAKCKYRLEQCAVVDRLAEALRAAITPKPTPEEKRRDEMEKLAIAAIAAQPKVVKGVSPK